MAVDDAPGGEASEREEAKPELTAEGKESGRDQAQRVKALEAELARAREQHEREREEHAREKEELVRENASVKEQHEKEKEENAKEKEDHARENEDHAREKAGMASDRKAPVSSLPGGAALSRDALQQISTIALRVSN